MLYYSQQTSFLQRHKSVIYEGFSAPEYQYQKCKSWIGASQLWTWRFLLLLVWVEVDLTLK